MNKIIFTLSGLDGSGKTTQTKLLQKYLEDKGHEVEYFHATQASIANKFFKKVGPKSKKKSSVTKANSINISLRIMVLFMDIIIFKINTAILSSQKKVVLADRYFYDSLVNISYLKDKNKIIASFLLRLIPKPAKSFYIKIEPVIIMQRDRKPDQGLSYLNNKSHYYNIINEQINVVIVDGTLKKNTVHQTIVQEIEKTRHC